MIRGSTLAVAVLAVLGWGAIARADDQKNDKKPADQGSGFIGIRMQEAANGVEIVEVLPGSPAEKAHLKVGDIVKKVAGKEVKDPKAMAEQVSKTKPGDKVVLSILRDGKDMDITVTVGKAPPRPTAPPPQ